MPEYKDLDQHIVLNNVAADRGNGQAKSIWVSSLSNFSVQYNFAVIAIALKIMDEIYPQTDWIKSLLKGVVFAGAITGQLVMGYVGDVIGRNKAMSFTIALAGIGSLASAFCAWGSTYAVYGIIAASRFILGVGVGGVYPLSATKAAEESATTNLQARNLRVAKAFFWQMPGAIFPYVMALVCVFALPTPQWQFRMLFALGSIPTFVILYGTMNESDSAEFNDGARTSTLELLKDRQNWVKLVATGGCWMIYDIVYYGTSLFSPTIVDQIFKGENDVVQESWQNIVVNSAGIPAVIIGILMQQRFGTKSLQVLGFIFIGVSFYLLAGLYNPLRNSPEVVFSLYILLLFALNWGPNITTFILPAEVYPPKVRSTMNGISAALGKFGAIIGTFIYQPIYDAFGMPTLMAVAGSIAMIGAILSYFTVHSMTQEQADAIAAARKSRESYERVAYKKEKDIGEQAT
mmetsp:Transcript_25569/g.45409  ORF Transcript_25569/g.45409 Transcript_25569/m.45409 type:complete len:461 (+) Transcript_25569:79-1461(+)|eukprot:CAMPEP_0197541592 /NCGR_PEP_ID=MMETSP1318-20131121/67246_1 /TAXON_ID=552666 /ORGANISM="Partenskyella glossopodia, Strain RCC365" /LENGTH=460 /DNA_ID=CAMNT_0043100785 /DNA_START=8 /DNA_END=1390 /DNA_ORIENTATION=-